MASTPSTPSSSGFQIPENILDDLCSRFIINIPEEERQNLIRVFFQIELAHWFYLDFYCQDRPELKARGIKDFSAQIFKHCPTLVQHSDNVEEIHGSWRQYKMAVPTYGAILLDPELEHCLLVQGFWSKASWGFPKGKINEDEPPEVCAIREVLEETGFDISKLIDKEFYLEFTMNEQHSRLYLVPGVSRDTAFAPRTRKEIKKVEWFPIDRLPSHKKDVMCKTYFGLPPNSFFMVIPFVKPLRRWINKRTGRENTDTPKSRESSQTPKVKDMSKDGKSISEKKRTKQQEKFAQQNQQNYIDFMKYKDSKVKGRQEQATSPTKAVQGGRKGARDQASPPRLGQTKQHVQILKRDGTVVGSQTKKSLAPMFGVHDAKQRVKHHVTSDQFMPDAFKNFKLDPIPIMAAFVGTRS